VNGYRKVTRVAVLALALLGRSRRRKPLVKRSPRELIAADVELLARIAAGDVTCGPPRNGRRSYRYATGGPSAGVTTATNRVMRRGWAEHGEAAASPAEQDMRAQMLQSQRGWQPWSTRGMCGV